VGYVSANGSVSNLTWVELANPTGSSLLRGGFHIDDSGSFGGDLIVVSGSGTTTFSNTAWRLQPNTSNTVAAKIEAAHFEGVVTLTNDVAKWGPWAGKIITGDENLIHIFAIDPSGAADSFGLEIRPEDFDVIPSEQDLYACDPAGEVAGLGLVIKLNRSFFSNNNYIGDLVITQAGEAGSDPGGIFVIGWDGDNFVTTRVRYKLEDLSRGLEHVTFAPINLPQLTP